MKLAVLFSGGKDSTYAAWLAKKAGNELKYLATVISENPESFMYHTPNIGLTLLQSNIMGIHFVSKRSLGEKEKEVEDLKTLLKGLDIDGVVAGAIASNYQKERVERICNELGLKLLAPLWGIDREKYLRDLIKDGFEVIITSVSAQGLGKEWLGRKIDEKCISDLMDLNKKFGVDICGEGGEYESLVLNCPLFKKKINITDSEIVWDEKTGSGQLIIKDAKTV